VRPVAGTTERTVMVAKDFVLQVIPVPMVLQLVPVLPSPTADLNQTAPARNGFPCYA